MLLQLLIQALGAIPGVDPTNGPTPSLAPQFDRILGVTWPSNFAPPWWRRTA
jgi:hypothetical protein